jgi:hypothetical protein
VNLDSGAVDMGFEVPVGDMEDSEMLREQRPGGTKQKEVQADGTKDVSNDATGTKKPTKRVNKMGGNPRPFTNPFETILSMPEPISSVVEDEARSWLLSESHPLNPTYDVTQSAFTKSLLTTLPGSTLSTQDLVPMLSPSEVVSPVKLSTHFNKLKSKTTPARNTLTLAPLPSLKTKITNMKLIHPETSSLQSASRPFLAPPPLFSASSSSTASSHFCSETPFPSDISTAVSNQSKSHNPSIKISKHMADKLSSLEACLSHLEDEAKIMKV